MKCNHHDLGYRDGLKREAYDKIKQAGTAGKMALLEAGLFQVMTAARKIEESPDATFNRQERAVLTHINMVARTLNDLLSDFDLALGQEGGPNGNGT